MAHHYSPTRCFSWLHGKNSKVVIACVVIVVVWASFVGYVSWSMLAWISNVASFRETLQNGGFRIIHATSKFIPSFLWLPPRTVFSCQNQTQFIQVAHSLNMAGQLLGENNIYELDIFHFYAVTSDTTVAYEYTPPYPSSLDPLIGELLAYLLSFS